MAQRPICGIANGVTGRIQRLVRSVLPAENRFETEREIFLRHIAGDVPFAWDPHAGAKGVQLAELGIWSTVESRWIDIPELPR